MHGGFLFQAFIYLAAVVVAVPLSKRLGLGSVLGYLVAGVMIGPYVLGWVGEQHGELMTIAEFGVVMMLFIVGLELQPALLWKLRVPVLGMGSVQVVATAALITGVAMFFGLSWKTGLALGFILALSSTAIVLQSLEDKGWLKTEGGQASFAILLFQDMAVIPILALLPLLGPGPAPGSEFGLKPGWHVLGVVGAVAGIVVLGRVFVRPVFRFIAETRLREAFTATALLLVVGIALLMQRVGLSAALGTFLAGVMLAESEYRHELMGDIEPFKGLLLGLFFISIGAGIDFDLLRQQPGLIASLVGALVAFKFILLLTVGRAFHMTARSNWLLAFSLSQGGEFAFVLFAFATRSNILMPELASLFVLVVALSMLVTPLLMIAYERLLPRTVARPTVDPGVPEKHQPVLIAGFGRFGQVVGRLLRANNIGTTVLDLDPLQVDTVRRHGIPVFYGDALRLELLEAAGAREARVLVVAVDQAQAALDLASLARQHFPHLKILARAVDRPHAHALIKNGVTAVRQETFDAALELGQEALRQVGFRAFQARRRAMIFKAHEERYFKEQQAIAGDDAQYLFEVRRRAEDLEKLMQADQDDDRLKLDQSWDTAPEARA